MPIRPELRHHYSGRAWRETRTRILKRAQGCCEQCGVPQIAYLWFDRRYDGKGRAWWGFAGDWYDHNGNLTAEPPSNMRERSVRIILTIAHLNHVAGDDRGENLKALCQWCHLNYDKLHHAETRASRKDAARPLLKEAI